MLPASAPITRFAPSPTGMLHIGSARTALFNWLFARRYSGRYLLRIEDTDRKRSTDAAKSAILNGLTWLGLDWDGDEIYQSERSDRHIEVAQSLLDQGRAYPCYCTPDELEAMRQRARAEQRPAVYDGTWRDRDPSEAPSDIKPVLRFRANHDGETIIHDQVQGDVSVSNSQIDDLIMLRSDGTPTYILSVVVDDHDMEVTHVIRGDDHLTNAFRQKQIYEALSWQPPEFAHIPLIHGPDGAKLSKRHGALAVEAYRDMGYLPAALRNYLLRLGWSHGDDEIISTGQALEWFDLDAIGKSPARFDFDKLDHLNAHYMRDTPNQDLAALVSGILKQQGIKLDHKAESRLVNLMPQLKERAKTLLDIANSCTFLIAKRPLDLTENAKKLLENETKEMLFTLWQDLDASDLWSAEALEARIREFADKKGMKFGKVAQPLRAALTGGQQSPGIFDVMAALGREESLGRIADHATTPN